MVNSDWTSSDSLGINTMSDYVYNDSGLTIMKIELDKYINKTDTTHYDYEYDQIGNWVKKYINCNNNVSVIEERIIE